MNQRVFIDATYTLASGKSSGIERVVRNLLRECAAMSQAGQIPQVRRVVSLDRAFYEATDEHVASFSRTAAMHSNILSMTPSAYRRLASGFCNTTRSHRLRKWLLPQAGHLGIFKLPHSLRESMVRRRIAKESGHIRFEPGDLLLLPDAYWVNRLRSSVWPAAATARQQGCRVATVLYDLIPLTHPQFVGLKRRDAFLDYLKKAATHSDLLIAISKTVRDQVAEYLPTIQEAAQPFCQDIRSFQLGAELETVTGRIRLSVQKLFRADQAPYLMVATFDPRKNHSYLLDAFEQLWKTQPELKLCLVGRIGSRCDDVVERIRTHPRLNRQLFLFDDLSDAELQHCYRLARGVVFASVVEGFGLPIVESLWYGKRTFVSDTPIHREVGQEDCCYFKLDDPRHLTNAIVEWESVLANSGRLPALPTRKPTSWRESAHQIMQHCIPLMDDGTNQQRASRDAA